MKQLWLNTAKETAPSTTQALSSEEQMWTVSRALPLPCESLAFLRITDEIIIITVL